MSDVVIVAVIEGATGLIGAIIAALVVVLNNNKKIDDSVRPINDRLSNIENRLGTLDAIPDELKEIRKRQYELKTITAKLRNETSNIEKSEHLDASGNKVPWFARTGYRSSSLAGLVPPKNKHFMDDNDHLGSSRLKQPHN